MFGVNIQLKDLNQGKERVWALKNGQLYVGVHK